MNILLACVNYNSYDELNRFLDSVERAYKNQKGINLLVCIADNSKDKQTVQTDKYSFDCEYYPFGNVGYFGGATGVFDKQSDIHRYDYVIISNVDLEIDLNLFKNLPTQIDKSVGWLSPSILSSYENRDKGMGYSHRPSKLKLKLLKLMYRYPTLLYIVSKMIYKRKKIFQNQYVQEKQIYSGHGSFIILTRNFFKAYPKLHYPIFLYGEEVFLGELIRLKGMSVIYNPALKIYDSEHVSTSQMPSKFRCKCQYDSITFILEKFYS